VRSPINKQRNSCGVDMLYGVLLTFRRPRALAVYLDALAAQTRRVDALLVVDNDPQHSGKEPVEAHLKATASSHTRASATIHYLPQIENLGSAGGWATGQRFFAERAKDDDWVVLFDDDNPPADNTMLADLERFGEGLLVKDPKLAGVARTGAFFDASRGRIRRLAAPDLQGPVRVDFVGCGHFPLYRVELIRKIGSFLDSLFFGYVELEYGMRVEAAGYHLYVDGDAIRKRRLAEGRINKSARVKSQVRTALEPWRVYCTTRNLVYILRTSGHHLAALRAGLRRGVGRTVAQLIVQPRRMPEYALAGLFGSVHGWRGQLGRTVDPTAEKFSVRRPQPA
jgi:hypothetical protein